MESDSVLKTKASLKVSSQSNNQGMLRLNCQPYPKMQIINK